MSIENRSVFKMVSLRGSIKGLTIDPNEYLDNGTQLLKRLSSFEFKPSSPTNEVKRFLESQHHLDEQKLQALSLHAASKSIEVLSNADNEILSLKTLQAISINDSNMSVIGVYPWRKSLLTKAGESSRIPRAELKTMVLPSKAYIRLAG